jgi:hypothetical protein
MIFKCGLLCKKCKNYEWGEEIFLFAFDDEPSNSASKDFNER